MDSRLCHFCRDSVTRFTDNLAIDISAHLLCHCTAAELPYGLDLTKQMYLWLIQHKQSKQAKQVPKIGDPPFSYDLSLRRLTDDKPAMIPGANII